MQNLAKNNPLTLLFCLTFAPSLPAQDSNYWNLQLGTRSMLVGGTLTSGPYDNSAVFYNPASLAFVPAARLSINANAFKFESTSLPNGGGPNLNLISQRFTTYPQMVSNMLTHNPQQRLKIAFALFSRHSAHWDIATLHQQQIDILPYPGTEEFSASLTYTNNLTEPWLGFGAGYQLSPHLALGFSTFLAYRNQRYWLDINTRAASTNPNLPISSFEYHDELRVNILNNINKIAIHARWPRLRLGLTATLPSLLLAGWSRVGREIVFQNLPNTPNAVLIDYQRLVPSTYKYPLSVAAGISFGIRRIWLNINTEYFRAINPYQMVNAQSTTVSFPSTLNISNPDFLSYYTYANHVWNFGLSTEIQLSPKWTLHSSLRRDQSYHRNPNYQINSNRNSILSPSYDLYHATSGLSWTRRASVMSFGLNYALGYNPHAQQFANLSQPQYNNLLLGYTLPDQTITSHAFTLMLGYSYFFALQ